MQAEITSHLRSVETRVKDNDSEIRAINQQLHFAGQHYANRSVHTDSMKAWNKGRFRSSHRDELEFALIAIMAVGAFFVGWYNKAEGWG